MLRRLRPIAKQMLQHLDDMHLILIHFVAKDKTGHIYLHAFVRGLPICLLGIGYTFIRFETKFFDESF